MKPEEMKDIAENGPKDRAAESLRRYEEESRRRGEPIGTHEDIPGYGQAPEGIRTLRLPEEAPKKTTVDEENDPT